MANNEGISLGLAMGLIEGAASPAAIESAVSDWLDDHPEATTTVADGSITEAKLAQQLAAKVGQITSLSDEIDDVKKPLYEIENRMITLVESATNTNSYYIELANKLDTQKTYCIKIKVSVTGNYTVQAGTAGALGSMVDTLLDNVQLTANTNYNIFGYVPSVEQIDTIRLSSNTQTWSVEVYEVQDIDSSQSIRYVENRTLHLGSAVSLTADSMGEGWASISGGYSHSAGTEPLVFSGNLTVGGLYLLDFDISNSSRECCDVATDTRYKCQTYNGTTHISVVLQATSLKKVYFVPWNTAFEISNITFKPLQKTGGEEVTLSIDSTLYHVDGMQYGMWNIFLSPSSAVNAANSTRCVAIGKNAFFSLLAGHRNVGVGAFALGQMLSGNGNVSIGSDSGYQVKYAENTILIGLGAGSYATTSNDNVAIGKYALQNSGNGDKSILRNTCIGTNSGIKTYGSDNVFIGYQAGYRNQSGKSNVVIGANSLWSDSGDRNTLVGAGIVSSATGNEYTIGVGYGAIPQKSNQMMLGSVNITEVVMCGNKKLNFNNDGTVTWETV